MENKDILVKPILSEKSYEMMEQNKYTFVVHKKSTKHQIKQAVESAFSVKVKDVNVMNYRGKKKRLGMYEGRRSSYKKAVVTLKEGYSLPFFESV